MTIISKRMILYRLHFDYLRFRSLFYIDWFDKCNLRIYVNTNKIALIIKCKINKMIFLRYILKE